MDYRYCRIEDAEETRIITLQSPHRRNALSSDLLTELHCAFEASRDTPIRSIVLAASGPVFSAGHDLRELAGQDPGVCATVFRKCEQVMLTIQQLPVPIIAEVQGLATAAGCQLVAACDLAVAAEDAAFATPGVRIGLFCSTPMVPLVRAIGRKRAMEMLLTGDAIDARTALAWGLVNRVTPPDQLRECTLALARKIAAASAATVATGKRAFYETISMPDDQALESATDTMIRSVGTPDAAEGISAFLEKRSPLWPRS
jgi:enoyl-CoA hydratase/carnithine racemase